MSSATPVKLNFGKRSATATPMSAVAAGRGCARRPEHRVVVEGGSREDHGGTVGGMVRERGCDSSTMSEIRSLSNQGPKRMHFCFTLSNNRIDRGGRARKIDPLTDIIASGKKTRLGGMTSDCKIALLARNFIARNVFAFLKRAKRKIGVGDFGNERELSISCIPLCGFAARSSTLNLSRRASEKIDFPAGVEAHRIGRDRSARKSNPAARSSRSPAPRTSAPRTSARRAAGTS